METDYEFALNKVGEQNGGGTDGQVQLPRQ